jgi:60 kDa SS-A/Ro ribonucleoprotein
MANPTLFTNYRGAKIPPADMRNEAGGQAYQLSPKQTLAQYVMTGCLNGTFYAAANQQLETVLHYCQAVDNRFIAKLAIYARQYGYMKDMPALLTAVLAGKDVTLFRQLFLRVIDSGKMLRNFVQIMRSGQTGRKSLGTRPKKLVQKWLAQQSDEQLFRASVGQSPSLADIIKMMHPRPATPNREALYRYLIGRETDKSSLPAVVQQFEAYKQGETDKVPEVPFQMLTSLSLGQTEWMAIARQASWQMTRMNLNTFTRHGVFTDRVLTKQIAQRLQNPQLIRQARVFPYQLMVAYTMATAEVPALIKEALQNALEIAVANVPRILGKVYICPDVSGSMSMAVTGHRQGATSAVRCIDVAALLTAAILRANRAAEILPFDTQVHEARLNPRQRVMHNAQYLAKFGGGGTNCRLPLQRLNQRRASGDLVIYISDNQSWADRYSGSGTGMMAEWENFRRRNPQARLVCLDIQPYGTVQAAPRPEILHIGGFADAVFKVITAFAAGKLAADYWVNQIETVELEGPVH